MIADLQDLFGSRTFQEWRELADQVDCCLEPVLAHDEVGDHPQVRERGLVRADIDRAAEVLFPARIDGRPPTRRQPLTELLAEQVLRAWEAESL